MREAVIVSTARTPIGRAYKGAFNATPAPTLAAHAITAAVERAGIEPGEVDDCIVGAALPQGHQQTIGRTAALAFAVAISLLPTSFAAAAAATTISLLRWLLRAFCAVMPSGCAS